MKIEIDNFGRKYALIGDARYYVVHAERVMRQTERASTDRAGRIWRTPVRRTVHGKLADSIRQALAAEGR